MYFSTDNLFKTSIVNMYYKQFLIRQMIIKVKKKRCLEGTDEKIRKLSISDKYVTKKAVLFIEQRV